MSVTCHLVLGPQAPLLGANGHHCSTNSLGFALLSLLLPPGHNENQIQCLQPPPFTGEIRGLRGAVTSLRSLVPGSSRGWTPAPGPPVLGG